MVDEVLRPDGDAPCSIPAPWGFAARYSPADAAGCWIEFVPLTEGRTGFLVGHSGTSAIADALRAQARAALLSTADPLQTLSGLTIREGTAFCAVIDGDTMAYSSVGQPVGAIAKPGMRSQPLPPADARLVVAPLEPGATVLLSTDALAAVPGLPEDCAGMNPEHLADRVVHGVSAGRTDQPGSAAVLLYRHPPAPLTIRLPAEPDGLSVSRGKLRQWLAAAGIDSEICADVLLAVGEATANATEHAVVGAPSNVEITVDARFEPGGLRLSVEDNGRWKPASVSSGHRGHGVRLMNALMDSVTLAAGQQGTTVTMVKELPR